MNCPETVRVVTMVWLSACGAASEPSRGQPTEPDRRTVPITPLNVGLDLARPLRVGCFAWSERAATVACVTGQQSAEAGGRYQVEFIGREDSSVEIVAWEAHGAQTPPLALSPDARRAVESRLRDGAYVALGGEVLSIAPGDEVALPGTPARLAWRREWSESVGAGDSPHVVRDVIVLIQGSQAEREVTIEFEEVSETPARVRRLPGDRGWLLEVETESGVGEEHLRRFDAYVVEVP